MTDGDAGLAVAVAVGLLGIGWCVLHVRRRRVLGLRWPANLNSRGFASYANRYFARLGWTRVASTHNSIDVHVQNGAASLMAICVNPTLEAADAQLSLTKILSEVNTRTKRAYRDPLVFLTQGRMSDRGMQALRSDGIVVVPYTALPDVIAVVTAGTPETTPPGSWQRLLLQSTPARCKTLADDYRAQGRLDLALDWAEQFNAAAPNTPAGYLRVAEIQFQLKDYKAADRAAQASLRLHRNVGALRVLSDIRRRTGDKAGAIDYARQSAEAGSTQAGAHIFYLDVLLAYREHSLARAAVQHAQANVSDAARLQPYLAKIAALQ